MSYFIAHPVTPDMGLRESFNAMLSHTTAPKIGQGGYIGDTVHVANYRALLEDYPHLLTEGRWSLELAPRVDDSEGLAYLADILEGLCNDYPLYDGEALSAFEEELLREFIVENVEDVSEDMVGWIQRAIWDREYGPEFSEYGAWIDEEDLAVAIAKAHVLESEYLAQLHGQTELGGLEH